MCRFLPWPLLGVVAVGLAAGCTEIEGNIWSRADVFNRTVADYSNEATLLNLVRARNFEPLTFVGIAGTTGHNTLTGNLGLPTLTVGPDTPVGNFVPHRNYSFGPNSASASESSDFNLSVSADPGTYTALLTPLDAPTMAFFFELPFPPDIYLLLFVDHIDVSFKDSHGKAYFTRQFYATEAHSYTVIDSNRIPRPSSGPLTLIWCRPTPTKENPSGCVESDPTSDSLRCYVDSQGICRTPELLAYSYLALQGFTIKTERGAIPGQSTRPATLFCFDPNIYPPLSRTNLAGMGYTGHLGDIIPEFKRDPHVTLPKEPPLTCDNPDRNEWLPARAINPSNQAGASGGQQGSTSSNVAAAYACASPPCPKNAVIVSSQKKTKQQPLKAFYEFVDPYDNADIKIVTRSTRTIYYSLGLLVGRSPIQLLPPAPDQDPVNFFTVVTGQDRDCFTKTAYRGEIYCIPNEERFTKQIINILHELVALNTTPSGGPQPNTQTVRVTP